MAEANQRVVMISGANRGIGAALAAHLGAAGWRLSLGVRDPTLIPAPAGGALVCHFDAHDAASEARWVEATVERFGRIDAVIANAGIMIPKNVIEADDADLEALFQVNVRSPLRLVRAAWPWLTGSGRGRVVTIVSLSGKRVKTAQSGLYATSKFAANAMTHAIRQAGWEQGVRATAVCAGFVATDMAAAVTDRAAEDMTQPEDIARIVGLILDLPNTASIAEIPVNSALEEMF